MSVQYLQEMQLLIGQILTIFSNIIGFLTVWKHKLTTNSDFLDIINRPVFYLKTIVSETGLLSPACPDVRTNSIVPAQLSRLLPEARERADSSKRSFSNKRWEDG